MGRGLSDLQKKILDLLNDKGELYRRDLSKVIYGENPTRTDIVDLSRSIDRLNNRGFIDFYTMPWAGAWHDSTGFHYDFDRRRCQIAISKRGVAYLKGEELPPLIKTLEQHPGRCWCGAKLPAQGQKEEVSRHKLLPSNWKIAIIKRL